MSNFYTHTQTHAFLIFYWSNCVLSTVDTHTRGMRKVFMIYVWHFSRVCMCTCVLKNRTHFVRPPPQKVGGRHTLFEVSCCPEIPVPCITRNNKTQQQTVIHIYIYICEIYHLSSIRSTIRSTDVSGQMSHDCEGQKGFFLSI
jgi:hypothetical protein